MWDDLCNRWCFIVSAVELVAAYNDHGKQMKQWALNDEAKGLCFTVGQTRNKRKNFESGYWPSQPVCQVHEQESTQLGRFGHVVAFCYCTGSRELGNCTLPCATRVRWIICKFMNAQQNLLVYCQPFLHKRCCVILLFYPCLKAIASTFSFPSLSSSTSTSKTCVSSFLKLTFQNSSLQNF